MCVAGTPNFDLFPFFNEVVCPAQSLRNTEDVET